MTRRRRSGHRRMSVDHQDRGPGKHDHRDTGLLGNRAEDDRRAVLAVFRHVHRALASAADGGPGTLRLAEPIHHPPASNAARRQPCTDAHRLRGDGGTRCPGGCVRGRGERDDRPPDPLQGDSGRGRDDTSHSRRGGRGRRQRRRVLQGGDKPAVLPDTGLRRIQGPHHGLRLAARNCSLPCWRDVATRRSPRCAARSWPWTSRTPSRTC